MNLHEWFQHFILTYGYPALFIGSILEGDTFVVVAAILATRGYLSLPMVICVAFLGTFAADQFFFTLGKTQGRSFLDKRPSWQPGVDKVKTLLDRYSLLMVVGFRFVYGLRTVAPFVIGMSGFSTPRFILLNAFGAMVWAVVLAVGGYAFGHVLEAFLGDMQQYEMWIFLILALVALGLWLYHHRARRNRKALAVAEAERQANADG